MKLTEDEIMYGFSKFNIYDCAIRAKNIFSFLLLQDIDDAAGGDKRLLSYFPNDSPGERVDFSDFSGFSGPLLGATLNPSKAILVARNCAVASSGGGRVGMESPIPTSYGKDKEALVNACFNLATIAGELYAVGPFRSVCRRVGPNNWVALTGKRELGKPVADDSALPAPSVENAGPAGFDAVDGFNANDIYCVGGKGDAWHFDGRRWKQCPVPTNMRFESVCCAGDGNVYIGMQSGSVLAGRGDKWKIIHKDTMTLPFKDMVWFAGKVWCTSDYGLWTIENGKLQEADVPDDVSRCRGNLSVGDGVMLLAGMYGATVFDGKTWQQIY